MVYALIMLIKASMWDYNKVHIKHFHPFVLGFLLFPRFYLRIVTEASTLFLVTFKEVDLAFSNFLNVIAFSFYGNE